MHIKSDLSTQEPAKKCFPFCLIQLQALLLLQSILAAIKRISMDKWSRRLKGYFGPIIWKW